MWLDRFIPVADKRWRKLIVKTINANLTNELTEQERLLLSFAPVTEEAHYAFPCFVLAKKNKISPLALAEELAKKINNQLKKIPLLERVYASGPYLNFVISNLPSLIIRDVLAKKNNYGLSRINKDQRIMFEFSQPNPFKEFHIGHLRGTIVGQARINLYRSQGVKVVAANYQGDTGSHIAKILWALDKFYKSKLPLENRSQFLGQVYTRAIKELSANESYQSEVSSLQTKLESREKKLTNLWRQARQWSLDEFNAIYNELGIVFDVNYFESEMESLGKELVNQLVTKGIAHKSAGAVIVDLKDKQLDVLVVLKSNESSLYSTKDLALALKKFTDYPSLGASVVQTDVRQTFYFKQLTEILKRLGVKTARLQHLSYEMVALPEGTMSSRSGNIISYEMLRNEVLGHAIKEIKIRHDDWSAEKIKIIAKRIALATTKFEMLKVDANKIITFDIKQSLAFDGFTASYVLYTLARINSIFKKLKPLTIKAHPNILIVPEEQDLSRLLVQYPAMLAAAADNLNPAMLLNYLYEVTRSFASFYHACPIIQAEADLQTSRFALAKATEQVLVNGLNILGLETVEEM